jgi:hypothetical protein
VQQQRQERVQVETTRHRITGDVTLARNGFRSRVSDLLNASEREFIALTDVTIERIDGGETVQREFLAVSRQHIVFVTPLGRAAGDAGDAAA